MLYYVTSDIWTLIDFNNLINTQIVLSYIEIDRLTFYLLKLNSLSYTKLLH